MPSEARPVRGRTRQLARVLRGARSRQINNEMRSKAENPAIGSHPGGGLRGRQILIAAMPLPYWQASMRGHQAERKNYLATIWAHKRFMLLVGLIWVLLLLCSFLIVGFPYSLAPSEYLLWSNENADGQSLEQDSTWETMLPFFFPTIVICFSYEAGCLKRSAIQASCIPKEDQVVEACTGLRDLNRSECLKLKCCYSSLGINNLNCFTPLEDKPTQMFRIFVLGLITMIILACLPLCCCALWRKSKWANPLRRKVNRMVKSLKKQRIKQKKDAEMLRPAMEGEEAFGDEKEEERRALFHH